MKKIKLATTETKIVKEIFSVEKYAVVEIIPEYSTDGYYILYYKPRIISMHESKEDAINYIKGHPGSGTFIVPMTQILKEQYVQS